MEKSRSLVALRFGVVTGLALACAVSGFSQTIDSFSPGYGQVSNIITINGSGFVSGSTKVRFYNNVLASSSVTTPIQIQATVPSGASTGPISVQNGTGPIFYSAEDFVVIGQEPYITGFSPTTGPEGVTVDIYAANFANATAVRFNGVNASFSKTDRIIATVPVGATTGPITVVNPFGSHTTSSNFFLPPTITGFSPGNGRSGTNVAVGGKNFTGATAVTFNGLNAASFNVNSLTQIVAVVPVNATTGPIRVFAPAGSHISSGSFVVQPTLSSFTPGAGAVGTPVTVYGANFNVGTPTLRFNGVAASLGSVSFGQITTTVPGGATTGPLSITTTDGSHTNANNFYLPPSITGFSPSNSAPGSSVTISGGNFIGATAVTFNGVAASFVVSNNTQIRATVPAGVSTGPISVTAPGGMATSVPLFYGAPSITGFSPASGLPGTNVAIFGTNFLGATAVRFSGLNAAFNVNHNGQITATVPVGAQTGPISVVAPAGTNTSAASFVLNYTSDLNVILTDAPDPVTVTSNLVYTIVVTNSGPLAAPNVRLTNTLPASVILKSATTTQGSLATNGNPVIGTLGTLGMGAFATITLTVLPQSAETITNTASAGSDYVDPSPANNTKTATTTVLPHALLTIQRISANRVRVFWPVALTNYALEYKPVLATTSYWSNHPATPTISGDQRFITETNVSGTRFYRLRQ